MLDRPSPIFRLAGAREDNGEAGTVRLAFTILTGRLIWSTGPTGLRFADAFAGGSVGVP